MRLKGATADAAIKNKTIVSPKNPKTKVEKLNRKFMFNFGDCEYAALSSKSPSSVADAVNGHDDYDRVPIAQHRT